MHRSPHWRALVALAVAAVVVAPAWDAAASTAPTGARVGQDIIVNPARPIDANNSPSIAVNPRRPDNLVIAHRIDRPRFSGRIEWSRDGGHTWRARELPLPAGKDRPYAPDVAFGPDGTLYVLYVNLQGTGNDPQNLWLATSRDGGRTLGAPHRVTGRYAFQARLAVDRSGTVYVTWLRAEGVGTLSIVGATRVVAVHSRDGGRSFSAPVPVSDQARERVGAAMPVIDSRGRLVVVYEDFKDDSRDFQNLDGPAWEDPFALVSTVSADGGKSFERGREFESGLVPARRFLVYLPDFPGLAAGPDGELVVAWADARNGDEDVFVRRSTDGGKRWSNAVRVNDNRRRDGTTQYLPRAAVSPNGRIDVVFLDRRLDPTNVMTDAWLASSSDDGRSFSNLRLSSRSFDSRVGPVTTSYLGVDFGSRLGLVSGNGQALAAWTDSRLGTDDTGRQDIAAAAVTFPVSSRREGSATRAAALVLSVLGVAALVVWRVSRRRSAARQP